MIDFEKVIDQYHEDHAVVYAITATVDGEVVATQTDGQSADNLATWQIDEAVRKHIVASAEAGTDNNEAAEADDAIAQARGE